MRREGSGLIDIVVLTHWEPYVKKNPSMQNVVTDWYRWHLKWARNALRREPKWSPDFKK